MIKSNGETSQLKNPSHKSLPKITIVTPVKNSVLTLEKAIKSLISQNYPNLEYIVLDGGSTDGTLDIIEKYKNFINYSDSKDDGGNVMAYIEGIKKANADIIGFLNADDFYEPDILVKAGEEFANNPNLDLVSFRCRTVVSDGKVYKTVEEAKFSDMELSPDKIIQVLGINARFFKKELFHKYGFPIAIDEKGRPFLSNDLEYMIRFTLKGINNKTIDYVGYNYLSHSQSLTFTKNQQTKARLCEDKIFIAKKFLNSDELQIPNIWQKTFKKWIKKYRAILIQIELREGKWMAVKENLCLGIQESGLIKFPFYLLKTLLRR